MRNIILEESRIDSLQNTAYFTSAPRDSSWGQPPAGAYYLQVEGVILHGSLISGTYVTTEPQNELADTLSWLKLSESAFDFWNNDSDAIFDNL